MTEDKKEVSELKENFESKFKMVDKVDIFDTPQLRYDKLRKQAGAELGQAQAKLELG